MLNVIWKGEFGEHPFKKEGNLHVERPHKQYCFQEADDAGTGTPHTRLQNGAMVSHGTIVISTAGINIISMQYERERERVPIHTI